MLVSSVMVMRCMLYSVCGKPCTTAFTPGWVVNVSSMPWLRSASIVSVPYAPSG